MKALTLTQPHARLVALGVKPFETRSWATAFRGLLVIHAARATPSELNGITVPTPDGGCCLAGPFNHYLPADLEAYWREMPHSAIEALVVVENCRPGPQARMGLLSAATRAEPGYHPKLLGQALTGRDFQAVALDAAEFGDFRPGSWAWSLDLVMDMEGLIPRLVAGHQGLWNLPPRVEYDVLAAYTRAKGGMICKVCGCTDNRPGLKPLGPGGWAEDYLCSECHTDAPAYTGRGK